MTPRKLTPELLDLLPPDDTRAVRSRRDLARINRVMFQHAIMARALSHLPPPRSLADLGGGDARFMLEVAKRLAPRWPGVRVLVCDRQDIVSAATHADFAKLGWSVEVRRGDILETLPQADIITANLFLHHFGDAALARLLALAAAHARAFVACEPRRSRFAWLAAHMVFALGANAVTRHDAIVSVEAGFTRQELSMLWPPDWNLREQAAWPFSHVFVAHASSEANGESKNV
jgi:hypothetical protein